MEHLSKSFECTGDGDRNRGDDKANADNAKGRSTKRIVSALEVKSPIKELGIARQSAVPITIHQI